MEAPVPANILVDDDKGILTFSLASPSLKDCKETDISFDIQPAGTDIEKAVFNAWKDGKIIRQNVSKPFQAGSFTMKSKNFQKGVAYVVKMKKHGSVTLSEVFNTP